jgi:hypothetical protein
MTFAGLNTETELRESVVTITASEGAASGAMMLPEDHFR